MKTNAEIKKAVRAAYLLTPIYRANGAWAISFMIVRPGEKRQEIFGSWNRMQSLRARVAAMLVLDAMGCDRCEVDGALRYLVGSAESRVKQFLAMKEFQNGE